MLRRQRPVLLSSLPTLRRPSTLTSAPPSALRLFLTERLPAACIVFAPPLQALRDDKVDKFMQTALSLHHSFGERAHNRWVGGRAVVVLWLGGNAVVVLWSRCGCPALQRSGGCGDWLAGQCCQQGSRPALPCTARNACSAGGGRSWPSTLLPCCPPGPRPAALLLLLLPLHSSVLQLRDLREVRGAH